MPFKNKELMYASQAAHRERNFQKLWELLLISSCADCKISDPIVLDFDHLPGCVKKFDISRAVAGSTRSWNAIQKEIDKCEVVCSNCHRKRTAARGNWKRFVAGQCPV